MMSFVETSDHTWSYLHSMSDEGNPNDAHGLSFDTAIEVAKILNDHGIIYKVYTNTEYLFHKKVRGDA